MSIAASARSIILLLFLFSILNCSMMPDDDEVVMPIPGYNHKIYSGTT